MDHINLIGADAVRSAAHTMRAAADDMRSAANTISEALERQRAFMEDWLVRFGDVLNAPKCPKCRVEAALDQHECPLRGRQCTCCAECSAMCRNEADQS